MVKLECPTIERLTTEEDVKVTKFLDLLAIVRDAESEQNIPEIEKQVAHMLGNYKDNSSRVKERIKGTVEEALYISRQALALTENGKAFGRYAERAQELGLTIR